MRRGRGRFLARFPSLAGDDVQSQLADPANPETFERCQLDLDERRRHAGVCALHFDLLALRRADPVFGRQRAGGIDGAVIGEQALALRCFAETGHEDDRVLLVNFGRDLSRRRAIDPLLAPPAGGAWHVLWSSEEPRYGGQGTPPASVDEGIRCRGESALVLAARRGSSVHAKGRRSRRPSVRGIAARCRSRRSTSGACYIRISTFPFDFSFST